MTGISSLAGAPWLEASSLQSLFRIIAAAGGEARVAGGAVRNALLGEDVTEVDVATTLDPEAVTRAFIAAGYHVHPTGIDHGTVTVVIDGQPYEVTTLRHDVETDGRRARVAFTSDWEADAQRRDFTMNALYCDAAGRISDFVDGRRDIARRKVVFVGDAAQRIREDYLRVLRFFRFHARFGAGEPDATGLAACTSHRKGLDILSGERIRQEMFKLLAAPGAVATLKLMAARGILAHLLLYTEDWKVLERIGPDPVLRLSVLARRPQDVRERWRLSNAEAGRIETIAAETPPDPALRPQEQRAVLYQLGADAWRDLVRVARARDGRSDERWTELLALPERWPTPKLPVSGKDLLQRGLTPGPQIGETLKRLEDWWVASDFKPGKEDLLARI